MELTTVTTIDGSASAGIVTATTATTGGTTLTGGSDADVLTGGNGTQDTITGGKGNDTISGLNGVDTYVFADSATNNGTDTLTIVVADDKLIRFDDY